jgi:hypothetical protein
MMRRGLTLTLGVLALLTAAAPLALSQSRKVAEIQDHRLPLYFPHEHHIKMRCLDCHHTVVGVTPPLTTLPCVACHRSSKIVLKLSVEPRFHSFCRDCHSEMARHDETHGPVRDCQACHHSG